MHPGHGAVRAACCADVRAVSNSKGLFGRWGPPYPLKPAVAAQPSLGAARPFFTGWPSEACGRWSNVYDVSHLGSLWYPLDSGAFLLLKGLVRPMGDLYSRISFHRERWSLSPGFPFSAVMNDPSPRGAAAPFFKGRRSESEEHLKVLSNVQGLRRSVFNSSECHHVLLDASAVKNLAFLSQLSN